MNSEHSTTNPTISNASPAKSFSARLSAESHAGRWSLGHVAAIVLVALVLRVAMVFVLGSYREPDRAYEHGEIAKNLIEGKGFSIRFLGQEGPTSQQAPFYPALLAGSYLLFGIQSPAAHLAIQLLQCVAGVALVLTVVALSWRVLQSRPFAYSAGWLAAIYPPHVYAVTHLQVALWAALWLTLLMVAAYSGGISRGVRHGALLGVFSGLCLLTDPILLLALPMALAAAWLGGRTPDDGNSQGVGRWATSAPFVIAIGTMAVMLAPWLVRNYRVHGEFVFVKSTFGYALWQANNEHSFGTDKIPKREAERLRLDHDGSPAAIDRALWDARHETLYIDDVLLKPHGYREFIGLSEPARSRLLQARAVEFIRNEPAQHAELCLRRLKYFLLYDETNPKAAHPLYRLSSIAGLLLTLMGLSLLRDRWRAWWPLAAIVAVLAAFHVLTIMSARFRIPVEPMAMVLAASVPVVAVRAIAARMIEAQTTTNRGIASQEMARRALGSQENEAGPHIENSGSPALPPATIETAHVAFGQHSQADGEAEPAGSAMP